MTTLVWAYILEIRRRTEQHEDEDEHYDGRDSDDSAGDGLASVDSSSGRG